MSEFVYIQGETSDEWICADCSAAGIGIRKDADVTPNHLDSYEAREKAQLRIADEVLDRDVDTEPNAEEDQ